MISSQLTDDSEILFRRDIEERVREIAPFLAFDHDPYLVSAEGRLQWVWDAYTVTDRYPNAQPLGPDSRFAGANYLRNSVKVVVDAYNGTVRFFLVQPDEPIAAAYARIFPDPSSRSTRCPRSWWRTFATPRTCSWPRTRPTGSTTCPPPTTGRRPSTTRRTGGRSPRT